MNYQLSVRINERDFKTCTISKKDCIVSLENCSFKTHTGNRRFKKANGKGIPKEMKENVRLRAVGQAYSHWSRLESIRRLQRQVDLYLI